MTKIESIESLDKVLHDINNFDIFFCLEGKLFLVEIFKNVVPKARRQKIIYSSLANSYLCKLLIKIKFKSEYASSIGSIISKLLLRIGDGIDKYIDNEYIHLPSNMVIYNIDADVGLDELIDGVFPKLKI